MEDLQLPMDKKRLKNLLLSILAFFCFGIIAGLLIALPTEDPTNTLIAIMWASTFQIISFIFIIRYAYPKPFIKWQERIQQKIDNGETGWFIDIVKKRQERLKAEAEKKEKPLESVNI